MRSCFGCCTGARITKAGSKWTPGRRCSRCYRFLTSLGRYSPLTCWPRSHIARSSSADPERTPALSVEEPRRYSASPVTS